MVDERQWEIKTKSQQKTGLEDDRPYSRRSRRRGRGSSFRPGCLVFVLLLAVVLIGGAVWTVRAQKLEREQAAQRDSSGAVQTQVFPGDAASQGSEPEL